ncbi:MAG TPA: AMP-dependent synthetase [Firmicutes bacterium]|nr:AMP-dependent synthetase [Bacillota bacterium]
MNIFNMMKRKNKDKFENLWDKYYEKDKRKIEVPDCSIYRYFENNVFKHEYEVALNYFGKKFTYKDLLNRIEICAKAMRASGVRKGDVVTILMPNTPEAVISFYAVNKIGAIANMIHPLSSQEEIKDSIIKTKSVLAIAINLAYSKIVSIIDDTDIYKVVIVSAKDSMPSLLGLGYLVTQELKMHLDKSNESFIYWEEFYNRGINYNHSTEVIMDRDNDAVYLHSGGTTGIPKNIVLTNGNINAVIEQAKIVFPKIGIGDNILGILPMFHCFGLVVCTVAPLVLGATIDLIPQFDAKRFDRLLRKYKPTILMGVPTLYEALITNPYMLNVDMSSVKYVISGGDSLSPEKNKKVNEFLKQHNCNEHILQGYGMTETTGPAVVGVLGSDKLGSVGIPLPGNKVKIIDVDSKEEKKIGEIGEICISGPVVMSRYLDNKEETNNLIHIYEDGQRWVHTGDLGYMDEDGVLFFVQRLKRMLIVSGYNVYPSYIEEVILKHPKVEICGVIGIPHPYKVQVPKAFIVPKKGIEVTGELLNEIKEYCNKNLAKYMIPKEFVFRDSLPKTIIGKVNYRELEKEEQKN